MHRPPTLLYVLAGTLILVALAMPLQIMVLYGHGPLETASIFSKLTFLNWAVMFGCVVTAGLVVRASPRTRSALAALTLLVALNNLVVATVGEDFTALTVLMASAAFALLNIALWRADIRVLLAQPERRWWLHAPRVRRAVPVILAGPTITTGTVHGATFDLSSSGLFLPLPEVPLNVHDEIALRLTFGPFAQVRCLGRVVRSAPARGEYPAGVGIQFVDLDRRVRRELHRYLQESGA